MSINRNNYEEFFMMYADGELSSADRQAVDRFVMENPDLAPELELYHQLQLPEENVSFADKNSLYRTAAADINAANHEEKFLLYVDNELDAADKEKVERFVLQNPSYQESFTLLKQTKLPVETIVFPDKSSLYRKEEKRPVLYMRWTRMAAAAAFIGVAVLVWTLLPQDRTTTGTQTFASNQSKAGNAVTPDHSSDHTQQPNSSAVTEAAGKNEIAQTTGKQGNSNTAAATNNQSSAVKPENVVTEKQPDLIAQVTVNPAVEEKNQPVSTGDIVRNTPPTNTGGFATETANVKVIDTDHDDQDSKSIVHNAVYKELDTDDEKKSLYLGSIEINKDKLRGFFRKAGSLFRSKSKQTEEDNSDTAPVSRRTLK